MKAAKPDWNGRTVVCIASGPSLTAEDVELVRESGHATIVTNTTFRLAPWADVLFGFDFKWWQHYLPEVNQAFNPKGRRISASSLAINLGVETTDASPWFRGFGNSGAAAIAFAAGGGASRIILLGYDCAISDGEKHWHPDHAGKLSNCISISKWPKQFERTAALARQCGSQVINASRRTALTCFDRMDLEQALG